MYWKPEQPPPSTLTRSIFLSSVFPSCSRISCILCQNIRTHTKRKNEPLQFWRKTVNLFYTNWCDPYLGTAFCNGDILWGGRTTREEVASPWKKKCRFMARRRRRRQVRERRRRGAGGTGNGEEPVRKQLQQVLGHLTARRLWRRTEGNHSPIIWAIHVNVMLS